MSQRIIKLIVYNVIMITIKVLLFVYVLDGSLLRWFIDEIVVK